MPAGILHILENLFPWRFPFSRTKRSFSRTWNVTHQKLFHQNFRTYLFIYSWNFAKWQVIIRYFTFSWNVSIFKDRLQLLSKFPDFPVPGNYFFEFPEFPGYPWPERSLCRVIVNYEKITWPLATGFPLFSKYQIPGFLKVFGTKFQVFCAKFQVLSYKF